MESSKTRISDAQRELLENAYQHGLVTTSEKFLAEFKELSSKTGLEVGTIKVWINNRKRCEKRKPADALREDPVTSLPSIAKRVKTGKVFRQLSGHNLFCSSLWSGEMASWSMSERSREAHQRWSSLDVAERDHWKRQAAELNMCEPDELPASAKKRAVHASLRRLTAEFELLAKCGWSGFYVLIDDQKKEIKHFASPDSSAFLVKNSDILEKYCQFHCNF